MPGAFSLQLGTQAVCLKNSRPGSYALQIPQNLLRKFFDLRNMFSNQENIRMFFSKQEK